MQIDYFSDDEAVTGIPKQDKSDWFASITTLSGCINGSLSVHSFGIGTKTLAPIPYGTGGRFHINDPLTFAMVGINLA